LGPSSRAAAPAAGLRASLGRAARRAVLHVATRLAGRGAAGARASGQQLRGALPPSPHVAASLPPAPPLTRSPCRSVAPQIWAPPTPAWACGRPTAWRCEPWPSVWKAAEQGSLGAPPNAPPPALPSRTRRSSPTTRATAPPRPVRALLREAAGAASPEAAAAARSVAVGCTPRAVYRALSLTRPPRPADVAFTDSERLIGDAAKNQARSRRAGRSGVAGF
jgi:hypothetical protein